MYVLNFKSLAYGKAIKIIWDANSMKLYKKNVKLELRRNFFSQRVVEKWNMLPEDIVSAPSITSFKKKLARN